MSIQYNHCVVSHLVRARAISGYSAPMGARLGTLIEPAASAPGCLHFAVHKSTTDDDVWLISGVWSSDLLMNAWFATPELGVFSELLSGGMVSGLDFQTFAGVSSALAQSAYGLPGARKAG